MDLGLKTLNIWRAASFACLVAVGVAACGSDDGTAQTTKRMSGQDPCELITARDLSNAVGFAFADGESSGKQCSFGAKSGVVPMVMVGAGVRTTGGSDNPAPNVEIQDDEVAGVAARVARSTPNGDMCSVDVVLVPDDAVQVFSVVYQGTGPNSCDLAKTVAGEVLMKLPG